MRPENERPRTSRAQAPAGRRGFTLVELLTVIVIMILLFGILMPTISAVMTSAKVVATQTRINSLAAGAMSYKSDTGYYPGQQYPSRLTGDTASGMTGSQYLGETLFTPKPGSSAKFPDSIYTSYESDMLDGYRPGQNSGTTTLTGRAKTVLDNFPSPKAILYFSSRLSVAGLGQYKRDDNKHYLDAGTWAGEGGWDNYIRDTKFATGGTSNMPFNDGEFLLIAPGKDRKYGSGDDIKNF